MNVKVMEIKLSITEYLNETKPYLREIINLKNSWALKIELIIAILFISSIDIHKLREM